MSKPPSIPPELLAKVINGMYPVAIGGTINIISKWIALDKPVRPLESKYSLWSNIRAGHWSKHARDVSEALDKFFEAYIPAWIERKRVAKQHAIHADNARAVLNKMRQPNSKKQQKLSDDSETCAVNISNTLIPESFHKSLSIDTPKRIKALKSRNKGGDMVEFID